MFALACLKKRLFTFYHHGFRYGCLRISSSFGRLFLDPRMGNILFSAKYKQNTHTYTKWSRKLSISVFSDYYKTVFSCLSRGNEKLLKSCTVSRAVSRVIMRVRKPKVEYKLALQEKPQRSILTYYYKKQLIT